VSGDGKGGRGVRKGKAEGKGRRTKVGKGKGGDKSPAWSSQNPEYLSIYLIYLI